MQFSAICHFEINARVIAVYGGDGYPWNCSICPTPPKHLFAYNVLGDVTLEYLSELFYPDIYFPTRTQSAGK